jgi:dihydrofolate reductase
MSFVLGFVLARMSKIYTGATMSLDGYIAGPNESGFDLLFQWYEAGDIEMKTTSPTLTFRMSETDTAYVNHITEITGCLVVGRHLFDITNGWGGKHTLGIPYVVLTHSVPDGWERESEWCTFVTEGGIEAAVAKAREIAGDKGVCLNGGTIASQGLEAGLVDEVWVDLAPVILGGGTPFFPALGGAPYSLNGPTSVVEGTKVTHLRYEVVR